MSSTFLEKGLSHPHLRQQIDMDRIFVLPVDWNWHEMNLWLLPNKIRIYLDRIIISMPSGIVASEVVIAPNLPLHCGKFQSTITYLFSILTDCSNDAPSKPYK